MHTPSGSRQEELGRRGLTPELEDTFLQLAGDLDEAEENLAVLAAARDEAAARVLDGAPGGRRRGESAECVSQLQGLAV